MTILPTGAPDLRAICRETLDTEPVSWVRIGTGRNSRVYRVDLSDDRGRGLPTAVVIKFYRRDPGDPRDRLATEFSGLQFLWQNDVRAIPLPIATFRNSDPQCALYEYIAGTPAASQVISAADIDESLGFLRAMSGLRRAPRSDQLPIASEACFSIQDIAASVRGRFERLRWTGPATDGLNQLHEWMDDTLVPLEHDIEAWCRRTGGRLGVELNDPIGLDARTLSPSDFGFHNAIRRPDGSLAFVDFEYFGWDDPAKTIADFLLHPGMALDRTLKRRFAAGAAAVFSHVPALPDRARLVYPWFGLKWVAILLNDFLPERQAGSTPDHRARQFAKAEAFVERLAVEYADNPYLA